MTEYIEPIPKQTNVAISGDVWRSVWKLTTSPSAVSVPKSMFPARLRHSTLVASARLVRDPVDHGNEPEACEGSMMSGSDVYPDRPLLLAVAVAWLPMLVFETVHDPSPSFTDGGILGFDVLVASAFSAVTRHVGYALGGVTTILVGVATVDEGSMMGVLFVYVAFLLF